MNPKCGTPTVDVSHLKDIGYLTESWLHLFWDVLWAFELVLFHSCIYRKFGYFPPEMSAMAYC